MKTSLRASLEEAIQKWMDDSCEAEDWVECYVPHDTAELMAKAAAGVLESFESLETFLVREEVIPPQ